MSSTSWSRHRAGARAIADNDGTYSHKYEPSRPLCALQTATRGASVDTYPLYYHLYGGHRFVSYAASPASQDLRPPGPVPPDVVPFRHAGSADEKPPLCLFSMIEGADSVAQKGRAFDHHPEADGSPCATHVTNWIEDNHALVWSHFASSQSFRHKGRHPRRKGSTTAQLEQGGSKKTRGAGTTGGARGSSSTSEHTGGRGSEDTQEGADATPSQTTAVLPNVVGAGGLADFIPLLDATIGRCDPDGQYN